MKENQKYHFVQFFIWKKLQTFATFISLSQYFSEDSVEKDVCISVNGNESHLLFIDHSHGDMKIENLMLTYCPTAVLVVMAVDDTDSFELAEHILVYLTHTGYISDKVQGVQK